MVWAKLDADLWRKQELSDKREGSWDMVRGEGREKEECD